MWNGERPGFLTYIEEEGQGTQKRKHTEKSPRQRAKPPCEPMHTEQRRFARDAQQTGRSAASHPNCPACHSVLGRAMVARRRPPASPLDAQAPSPQALSGLCRSSFRGTEAARLASVQPEPSGVRPALRAPSGVNPHSQFLELGPPRSGICVERRAAGRPLTGRTCTAAQVACSSEAAPTGRRSDRLDIAHEEQYFDLFAASHGHARMDRDA